ncbi:regulator of telomere elongation helicase 1 homolog [Stylonychia lemnae]|uniref:Regulator of telomere elongation helicase 1 homolog n=1 Tax=Stylonychia lemnae TaxID=5949 RepID=A0A077ZW80_STYLE|nr:regulator of telomere elongation helicase 1 homolog [Stylonychia lemnae]|eukprot:CDW74129.1 regulator of telomere elongation helicase 1 homolog [Stylonychia lemnae]
MNDLDDNKITFSFDKRDDQNFFLAFAKTLSRIFTKVQQGGILVFLPSYTVLKKVHKVWRAHKLFKELFKDREIYIEPQDQVKNNALLVEYKNSIKAKGKAVFIAVCRGKLSEGIDFTDNVARLVIMAGIPYPQIYDPRVITKKDYLDRKYAQQKSQINGNMWYKLQACRAINQAIGRVIRHVNDFGAIILMDERYKSHNIEISKWLNQRKQFYSYLPELESDLERFFIANGCSMEPLKQDEIKFKQGRKRSSKANSKLVIKSNKGTPNSNLQSMQIKYEYDMPNLQNFDSETSSPDKLQSSTVKTEAEQLQERMTIMSSIVSTGFQKASGNMANARLKQEGNRLYRDDYDQGEFFAEKLEFDGEPKQANNQQKNFEKRSEPIIYANNQMTLDHLTVSPNKYIKSDTGDTGQNIQKITPPRKILIEGIKRTSQLTTKGYQKRPYKRNNNATSNEDDSNQLYTETKYRLDNGQNTNQ